MPKLDDLSKRWQSDSRLLRLNMTHITLPNTDMAELARACQPGSWLTHQLDQDHGTIFSRSGIALISRPFTTRDECDLAPGKYYMQYAVKNVMVNVMVT